ncbi:hypothetical protein [Pseudomonas chlororaphis]|uniref:hypothetical protein n=1 Tax=Pseudomonas chlororaphis TaxID=587753 RepID=UPI000F6B513C|nr:hypothetical protein [Pseudomonas chlororaphis]AZD76450.1 hypothetical protein C4K16_6135 [Pseudomonas chlororaphis subsp. aurantiaca]
MLMAKRKLAFLMLVFCFPVMASPSSSDGVYIKHDVLACGDTEVELVSECLNDAVESSQTHAGLPVCTDQVFKINGKENRRDIKKVSQLMTSGKHVNMLSNVVVSMACVKGSKGNLVSIGGYGGCGACPEWHGYYSMDGKLVNYTFSNSFRSFGSLGSRDELIEKFGVSKRDLVDESAFAQKVKYDKP